MKSVLLSKVALDEKGWLRLYPAGESYERIYRAAAGVNWEAEGFLHAREPGEWTYLTYFRQILSAVASEYGDHLKLSPATEWLQVPEELRRAIESSHEKMA
jgi:hypothetical protein